MEGKVFIEFVVNVDGTLSDFVPVKGIGAGCDQEAIRVLQTSPISWIPGKQKSVSVKQRMVIPIIFQLEGSEKKLQTGQVNKPTLEEIVVVGQPPKKN